MLTSRVGEESHTAPLLSKGSRKTILVASLSLNRTREQFLDFWEKTIKWNSKDTCDFRVVVAR